MSTPAESDGETYICEEYDGEIEFDDDYEVNPISERLQTEAGTAAAYLPGLNFDVIGTQVEITFPTSVIPQSLALANNMTGPFLCKVSLQLSSAGFSTCPASLEVTNPSGHNFLGAMLVKKHVYDFFGDYDPKRRSLRSAMSLLKPEGVKVCEDSVKAVMAKGFSQSAAEMALLRSNNNVAAALRFLKTGDTTGMNGDIGVRYSDGPLVYLALEVVDAFWDLTDHCCMCGEPLKISGIRPMVCENKLCFFQFVELGLGAHVVDEIRRDPTVCDLVICFASCCFDTPYLDPAPPDTSKEALAEFFKSLPAMSVLASCSDDRMLIELIGMHNFQILRFFILANRAFLVTLRGNMRIQELPAATHQFMIVATTPEHEARFQAKKAERGNVWLWHGSWPDRWYSILHNGLHDYAGTSHERNGGAWFGNGVYQSDSYQVSFWYANNHISGNDLSKTQLKNNNHMYKASILPEALSVVGLVENVPGKSLNNVAQNEWTQKDEMALVVRVLMVSEADSTPEDWNTLQKPPRFVPTLSDLISEQ